MSTVRCTLGSQPISSTITAIATAAHIGKGHDSTNITTNFAWPGWWFDPSAGDFGWPDVVAESDLSPPSAYPAMPSLPGGAVWVVPPSMNGAQFPIGDGGIWRTWVYRNTFTLPPGVVTAATLNFVDYENSFGLWVNGNSVSSGSINPSYFRPGALNLLAAGIQMQPYGFIIANVPTCLAFTLSVTVGTLPRLVRFTTPLGVRGRVMHHG